MFFLIFMFSFICFEDYIIQLRKFNFKLTGTAMLVLGFLVLDWADTVGHIEIARS